jgi:hypothetical protein
MNTKAIFLYFVTCFLIFTSTELFPNRIEIRDTTIVRSRLDTIPIFGKIDSTNPYKIKVAIKFNAYLLEIKKIIGGSNMIFQEPEPLFTIQLNNIEDAIVEITSGNVQPAVSSILCKMVVEGLVYRDSICIVSPLSLWINDTLVESELISDTVKVVGLPIFQNPKNFLDNPFPLPPMGKFVQFDFGVANVGTPEVKTPIKVRFYVFNSAGMQVFSSEKNQEIFSAISIGSKIPIDLNKEIDAGVYRLTLTFPSDFAEGVYYLQMRTSENIVLHSKFLYIRNP